MSMAQVRYSKTVPEPDRVMKKIGECRAAMLEASRSVRPFGPAYHALSMVVAAIDGLAAFITGERHYFSTRLGDTALPHASPGLDLDASPHETPQELAPYRPKQ